MKFTSTHATAAALVTAPLVGTGVFFAVSNSSDESVQTPRMVDELLKAKFELVNETESDWQELSTANNIANIDELKQWCSSNLQEQFEESKPESVEKLKEVIKKCAKRVNFKTRAEKLEIALFNQSSSKNKKFSRMIDMMQEGYSKLYSDIKAINDAKESNGTTASQKLEDKYTKYCEDKGALFWNTIPSGKNLEQEWKHYQKACANLASSEVNYWR